MKFSSFLKNVPPGQVENQIDVYINNKVECKNSNSLINSLSLHHSKIDYNTNFSNKKEILNKLNSDKIVINLDTTNQIKTTNENNEMQYYEREISIDEENKLKTALSKHFIFQDLNEDIMYYNIF